MAHLNGIVGPLVFGTYMPQKKETRGRAFPASNGAYAWHLRALVYRAAYGSPFKAAKHGNICHILGSASCNRLRLRSLQLRVDGYNGLRRWSQRVSQAILMPFVPCGH